MRREEHQALAGMFVAVSTVLFPIILVLLFMLPRYLHPYNQVVINKDDQLLIRNNKAALEDSILKNCIEEKIYNFNDLIFSEWDTVYFIRPYIKDNLSSLPHKIYKKAGYYWDYVPDITEPSSPGAQTHILFKKDDKVVAYRPNNYITKPFHMYLSEWSEGEFNSADNPKFEVTIIASDIGGKSISLKHLSDY